MLMNQKGKGNVADTGVLAEARELIQAGKATDICEALKILMKEAIAAGDKAKQRRIKIKATEKAMGCRRSSQQKN